MNMKCLKFGLVYENLKHILYPIKSFNFLQSLIMNGNKKSFSLPPTTRHVSKTSSPYNKQREAGWKVFFSDWGL